MLISCSSCAPPLCSSLAPPSLLPRSGFHARAHRALTSLQADTTSLRKHQAHCESKFELQSNRWFVREELSGIRTYQKRVKPRKVRPWKLIESIWARRRKTSASGDFFDTAETRGKAFANDWKVACTRQQLGKKLQRAGDKLDPPDTDALEACFSAMSSFADVVLHAFTFYSALGSANDIVSIGIDENASIQNHPGKAR